MSNKKKISFDFFFVSSKTYENCCCCWLYESIFVYLHILTLFVPYILQTKQMNAPHRIVAMFVSMVFLQSPFLTRLCYSFELRVFVRYTISIWYQLCGYTVSVIFAADHDQYTDVVHLLLWFSRYIGIHSRNLFYGKFCANFFGVTCAKFLENLNTRARNHKANA